MKIILISGLSGSGKSVALKLLEDTGCYCVDNLPIEMLPALVAYHIGRGEVANLAVSIDIRSHIKTGEVEQQLARLKQQGHSADILFLEAAEAVLLRRFPKPAAATPSPPPTTPSLKTCAASGKFSPPCANTPTASTPAK